MITCEINGVPLYLVNFASQGECKPDCEVDKLSPCKLSLAGNRKIKLK